MEGLSQESLCSCGSGKKYESCCLGKIIEFPKNDSFEGSGLKTTSEIVEIFEESLEGRDFYSLGELNEELRRFSDNQNSLPKAPFLGLSSAQMHRIIYSPFSLKNEIFYFQCEDLEELTKIPLLTQALYFLNKLNQVGQLKATQKGNLPRAFVIELYHEFFSNSHYCYVPNKESDSFPSTRLKYLLFMSGLIKKRSNKFSLTKKGERILVKKKMRELFDELIHSFFNKWNWGVGLYPEFSLMQDSAVFNLHLLNKIAQDWILDEEIGKAYLCAFPELAHEVNHNYWSPEKKVTWSFSVRFLERVCLPMGLLELKEEGEKYIDRKTYYKVSPFFKRCFEFT